MRFLPPIKPSLLLVMAIAVGSCTKPTTITTKSFNIEVENHHPFLSDHERKLVIKNNDNEIVTHISLYHDPGCGVQSSLFKQEDQFILIDANGYWYHFDEHTGELTDTKWNWDHPLPSKYLGTFRYINQKYELARQEEITPEQVYRFKDP